MAGKVVDKDQGLNAMVNRLAKAAGATRTLQVGLLEAAESNPAVGRDGQASGLSISELGEIHEFGLGVPQRSFIRDWYDGTEQKHRQQFSMMAKAIVKGTIDDWDQGLNRLGLLYVAEIQERIKAGILPELEEATIAAKGSSTPLIDTGQLWTSITHEVV